MQCVLRDNGILSCTDIRVLSLQTLHELMDEVERYERTAEKQMRLMSFEHLEEINLNFNKLIAFSTRRQKEGVHGKTALICTTPVTYGLARMWQSIMDDEAIEIQIFETYDAGQAWLLEN